MVSILAFSFYSPPLIWFQTCILPEQRQGPQGVSSVLGEQVGGGKRGGELERQTTSEGHLVNSGNRERESVSVCHIMIYISTD